MWVIVALFSLACPSRSHRMERLLDTDNDIGPMERVNYFDASYNGQETGYYGVGLPWLGAVPVPKLVIRRIHGNPGAGDVEAKSLTQGTSGRVAVFRQTPGDLPLDAIPAAPGARSVAGARSLICDNCGTIGGVKFLNDFTVVQLPVKMVLNMMGPVAREWISGWRDKILAKWQSGRR